MSRFRAPPIGCAALAWTLALAALGCVPAYSPSRPAPTLPIRRTTAIEVNFVILGSFAPDLERFVDWIVVGNPSIVRRVRGALTPSTVTVEMFASGRPGQLGTCAVVMSATNGHGEVLATHTFSHDCGWSSGDQPDFVTQVVVATIEQVASALPDVERNEHAGGESDRVPPVEGHAEPAVEPREDSRRPATRRRRPPAACSTACPRAQRDENGCCP